MNIRIKNLKKKKKTAAISQVLKNALQTKFKG